MTAPALSLLALLKRIEWMGDFLNCPECKFRPHESGCELAALIKSIESTTATDDFSDTDSMPLGSNFTKVEICNVPKPQGADPGQPAAADLRIIDSLVGAAEMNPRHFAFLPATYRNAWDRLRAALSDPAQGPATDDAKRGLYNKFQVRRSDGSSGPGGKHEHCRYYVLDLDHDPFSMPALAAYASACEGKYPELAADLRALAAHPGSASTGPTDGQS